MKPDIIEHGLDATMAKAGLGMTASGSLTAVYGGLTLTEWAAVVGIVTAIVGLIVQIVFNVRNDRRKQLLFEKTIREYEG